jgi:hypothetical protein
VNNVRRIQRHLQAKEEAKTAQPMAPDAELSARELAGDSFWTFSRAILAVLCSLAKPNMIAMIGLCSNYCSRVINEYR